MASIMILAKFRERFEGLSTFATLLQVKKPRNGSKARSTLNFGAVGIFEGTFFVFREIFFNFWNLFHLTRLNLLGLIEIICSN